MATPAAAPTLTDRTDIHKSCKSLENILNLLNEYCEAVGAIVNLQKKLAKALRETASLKGTGDIAAGALNGSAIVFEALLEIDTKYTKFADKEYDTISAEVKKWFKKLVKEEKAHDQKLEKANMRIKQAGQSYEKKSKKNASDAAEEHARYINLISTLGPEISQEKYNHTLNVTQRNNATTYSVASCLARIADAEWLKACEGVRTMAPTIGSLTQWRVLCEGGWSEAMPRGLPDIQDTQPSTSSQTDSTPTTTSSPEIPNLRRSPLPREQGATGTPEQKHDSLPVIDASPTHQRHPLPSAQASPNVSSQTFSSTGSPTMERSREPLAPPSAFDTLKPPFFDPATGSVRTLSAFPAPPTHFPLPPVRQQTQQSLAHSVQSSSSIVPSPIPQLSESPLSASQDLPRNERDSEQSTSYQDYISQAKRSPEQHSQEFTKESIQESSPGPSSPQTELRRPHPVRALTSSRPEPLEEVSRNRDSRDEQRRDERYEQDAEFGVQRGNSSKAHTYDGLRSRGVERTDSVASNGSVVAAMRDRYSSNPGSTSPSTRELPRIPLSVTDLAARYQSPESMPSSRPRASSPPVARQLSFPMDQARPRPDSRSHERMSHRPGSNSISTSTPTIEEDVRRRRQRAGDYTEAEFKERERELHEREREIEARTRELERERAQLRTVHEGSSSPSGRGNSEDSPRPPVSPLRPRRTSLRKQLQRPLSQMELEEPEPPWQRSQFSNNLAPSPGGNHQGGYTGGAQQPLQSPAKSVNGEDDYRDHRYSEDGQSSTSTAPHAPYCGCHACSASKYGASSRSGEQGGGNALRPPSSPDKPKGGWMRRLSMPGMMTSAFNIDPKRNSSNYSLGSGVSSTMLASGQKKGLLSFDGRKNSSATNLLRVPELGRVQEDGRVKGRRSFDGRP